MLRENLQKLGHSSPICNLARQFLKKEKYRCFRSSALNLESKSDLTQGGYQVLVAQSSKKYPASPTADNTHHFKYLLFGLPNPPATFERPTRKIFID